MGKRFEVFREKLENKKLKIGAAATTFVLGSYGVKELIADNLPWPINYLAIIPEGIVIYSSWKTLK